MKGLVKYKSTTLWMVLVFAIAFIVFNYNMQAKITVTFEARDTKENSYKYSCAQSVYVEHESYDPENDYKSNLVSAIEMLDDETVTVSVIDLTLFENNHGFGFLTDMYIGGGMPKYNLINGNYPTKEQLSSGNLYAVLGKNKMEYAYSRENKQFIMLDGLEYEVTGCMSTGRSKYLDNEMLIFNGNYGDSFWDNMNDLIIMGMVNIVYESDKMDDISTYAGEFEKNS